MSKYVPISEVTAFAQTIIKSADNMDRNIWKYWVYLALLNLGISDDDVKVCTLHPKEYAAGLPPDCRQIIEVSLFDANGNPLPHTFRAGKQRIYNDRRILREASTSETTINDLVPVDVSNDATHIHLGTNGSQVEHIVIRYFAYPLDQNGEPMVAQEDVMACAYFIRYMTALREDDNRSKIEQDKMDWFREADRSRARKKMSSMAPDKAKTLMNQLMSRVPNFRSIQSF
jgi:hypothetical protein